MQILWNYLKPHRWLVLWALLPAGLSQVLIMIDPLIFGKIINDYTTRPPAIMHADTIIVPGKGKIAETGTHNELVEHKGLYYAMWRQQIGEKKKTCCRAG